MYRGSKNRNSLEELERISSELKEEKDLMLLRIQYLSDELVLEQRRLNEYSRQYEALHELHSRQYSLVDQPRINTSLPKGFCAILLDSEYALAYLLKMGLVPSSRICRCGNTQKLRLARVHYKFACDCGQSVPFFTGTLWEGVFLTHDQALLHLFLWIFNLRNKEMAQMMGHGSMHDIKLLSTRLRHLVASDYSAHIPLFSGMVEIDESCFGSSVDNSIAKWVFGIYERNSKLTYMQVVHKRNENTLLPIIKERCAQGTTIISDQWAAYGKLEEHGYPHYTVDHSRFFVNPHNREIHTQHIENTWGWAKYEIKRRKRGLSGLQDYLHEFCWKRQFKQTHRVNATIEA